MSDDYTKKIDNLIDDLDSDIADLEYFYKRSSVENFDDKDFENGFKLAQQIEDSAKKLSNQFKKYI